MDTLTCMSSTHTFLSSSCEDIIKLPANAVAGVSPIKTMKVVQLSIVINCHSQCTFHSILSVYIHVQSV